ncbi:MAG: hypothetical protein GKR98_04360 [Boseongicola sp.]|nr:MAG: hypothetical protein GKR98_04360 [Boseongicola sp.]
MSEFLDWIILNSWAAAAFAVVFSVVGYAITRRTALRGASNDDSNPWIAFCVSLYPDTRKHSDDDTGTASDQDTSGADGSE